jgi:microcystin-dependent protein
MKVSSRGYGDAVRGLSHGKGAKVSLGRGIPAKREGSDGDLTLRNTNRGVILYAKYGGRWYSIHTQQPLVPNMIIMWSGATSTIPTNWAICDGQNGTPDLRCRFILSSGSGSASAGSYQSITAAPGDKATASAIAVDGKTETTTSHSTVLTPAQMPIHSHTYHDKRSTGSTGDLSGAGARDNVYSDPERTTDTAGNDEGHTHSIGAIDFDANESSTVIGTTNLPQVDYYTLAFIMFTGGGSEPGTEGFNWGGGSGELGRVGG